MSCRPFIVSSSNLRVILYHLLPCLNVCVDPFLFVAEPSPVILSLNLLLSLSTCNCAIIKLPTMFSSSMSLPSPCFSDGPLVCIFYIQPVSYVVVDFIYVRRCIHHR